MKQSEIVHNTVALSMYWLLRGKYYEDYLPHIEYAISYYQARNFTSKQRVNVYLNSYMQRC